MYSHLPFGPVPDLRGALEGLAVAHGMRHVIDTLEDWGSFQVQRSWMEVPQDREDVRVFRYEDLARDNRAFLRQLFDYLDVSIPDGEFSTLYARHTFARHAGGRSQGEEDAHAHYRKGVAGDWRNHFDRPTLAHFRQVTGDLIQVLGYED
jgi:hypothetical protein